MGGMVLLFSSDYYPVYKQDIFSIASLPNDYCYHFRYKEKYVSGEIVTRVANRDFLSAAPALIIFVHNNKDKSNKDITFTVIRRATIVTVHKESATDLYHVYFKLGAFVDMKNDVGTFEADQIPQEKYFGWRVISPELTAVNWNRTIEKLLNVPDLGTELFFNVRLENDAGAEIVPKCDQRTFEPFFEITEGKSYRVTLRLSDTTANKKTELNHIKTSIEGTDIKTNIGAIINPGVDIDDRYYRLTGLLLGDISSPVNVLRISSNKRALSEEPELTYYQTNLLFNVRKDPTRFWRYFFFSLLVFLGGGLIAADFSKLICSVAILIWMKIAGLFIAAVATAMLFYLFNKK